MARLVMIVMILIGVFVTEFILATCAAKFKAKKKKKPIFILSGAHVDAC